MILRSEEAQSCEMMICCGDLCAPFIIDILNKNFANKIHIVFGNNDGDQFLITKKSETINRQSDKFLMHGQFALDIRAGNKKIGVSHYPGIARNMAQSGNYDAVFFGHNHIASLEKIQNTLLVNPGAVMGWNPSDPDGQTPVSFLIYESGSNKISFYELSDEKIVAMKI